MKRMGWVLLVVVVGSISSVVPANARGPVLVRSAQVEFTCGYWANPSGGVDPDQVHVCAFKLALLEKGVVTESQGTYSNHFCPDNSCPATLIVSPVAPTDPFVLTPGAGRTKVSVAGDCPVELDLEAEEPLPGEQQVPTTQVFYRDDYKGVTQTVTNVYSRLAVGTGSSCITPFASGPSSQALMAEFDLTTTRAGKAQPADQDGGDGSVHQFVVDLIDYVTRQL